MKIEYRKLQPHESKMYRAIRLESLEKYPEAFGANYHEALKIEKFRIENDIEDRAPERFVFGAFADQNLIGICTFVKNETSVGNLYQMYVKKEFQGKNIAYELARSIIKEIKSRFHDVDIFLEVIPGNEKAYHLYKKIGFKEIIPKNSEKGINFNILMQHSKNE